MRLLGKKVSSRSIGELGDIACIGITKNPIHFQEEVHGVGKTSAAVQTAIYLSEIIFRWRITVLRSKR
jgi:hypothetical protein